jgi:hypothetical protein
MDHETGEDAVRGEPPMTMEEKREFHDAGELEEAKNGLARASRHPMHVDFGTEYAEGGVPPLSQEKLDGGGLSRVEPVDDLFVVWNNREDRRAYVGSGRYNLIQHREVLDAVQEAVGRTTGSIEKGVIRDYGEHVRGVLVFGDQDEAVIDVGELVGDGYVPPEGNEGEGSWAGGVRDRLGLGMRFHNSFDGRSGYGASTMGYRFICGNWLVWGEETVAEKASYHIKSADDAPGVSADYFEDVIHEVFERRDPLAGTVKDAVEEGEVPLSWVPGLLERAGFGANYARRISAHVASWEDGSQTDMWTVYNAATHHLDNERAADIGPESYDRHQGSAWELLEMEPSAPADEVEDLAEYAAGAL